MLAGFYLEELAGMRVMLDQAGVCRRGAELVVVLG